MDLELQRLEETIKRLRERLQKFTFEEGRLRLDHKRKLDYLQLEHDRALTTIARDRLIAEKELQNVERKLNEKVHDLERALQKHQEH